MKKAILLTAVALITLAVSKNCNAQWSLTGNAGTVGTNFLGTTDNVALKFKTKNLNRMIITGGGNVGIGTTAPGYKLQVIGTGRFEDGVKIGGFGIVELDAPGIVAGRLKIDSSGNVGIGVPHPVSKLEVAGATKTTNFQMTSGAFAGSILQGDANGNASWVFQVIPAESDPQVSSTVTNNIPKWNGTTLVDGMLLDNGTGIGIGNNSPHAPLQFATSNQIRKIVLFETANNDNQFFGFGVNGGQLRYQTGVLTDDHVFYAAASSTTSNELMRIKGNGNVGIGAATPQAKLDVNGNIQISNASIPMGLMTEIGGFSPVLNTSVNFREQNKNTAYKGAAFRIDSRVGQPPFQWLYRPAGSSNDNLNMVLDSAGNVGIGNTNPHAPLQFSNGTSNRKIVLYEGANNDNQFNGFGLNAGVLRYQVNNTGDAHVFYAGASPTTSNELMRVNGNGNVGIGTATPFYKLEVCGTIRANEVRVETSWCDYVFAKDYKLLPLEDVESFIKENKHLPDVTPGAEIETNGLEVGKISAQMIRKIEELTLYIIEQEKAIQELKTQNTVLETKMNSISEKGGK